MPKETTFSIIIPAFNEERHIAACLKAIADLDYPRESINIWVVDNGSTDRTVEIAKGFRVNVLRDSTKNVSGLRNFGAEHARGDVLAFVDADCLVARDWLKNAVQYMDKVDMAAWGAPPVLPEESTWVQRTWSLVRLKEKEVQEVDWLESMNLFVRKELFTKVGGFDESLVTCEDVDFCYRLLPFGKIISDARMKVIHLGEASTLREFVKKETWRGKSNLAGVSGHGLSWKEIPSLAIPLYFGIFLPIALLTIPICLNFQWLWGWVLLFFLPGAAALFKVRRKKPGWKSMISLFILIQFYFLSRTAAMFLKKAERR